MRIALGGFPPLLMAATRFLCAGSVLFVALRLSGAPGPTRSQWLRSAAIGVLLLAFGNGGVATAEQWVSSGLAAITVASVPLWAALFNGFFERWPTRREWVGLVVGTTGVAILNLGGDFRAQALGFAVLIGASASWALGSVWSRRLDLPKGMMASAAQMLTGGSTLLVLSMLRGERLGSDASGVPLLAVGYLAIFGSIVGYSAYGYLLRNASASVATSYAFVNPLVAVLLGVAFAHEEIHWTTLLGMAVILAGVALVAARPRAPRLATAEASIACRPR